MKTRSAVLYLAIAFVVMSVVSTGLGGWVDMMGGKPLYISREHAWNDGIYAVLLGIFLVLLSDRL